jgi:PAS domain S-box-containing protein
MIATLRAKIGWTFTALVALNLASGFWSIYNFYTMGTTVTTMLGENYNSVLAAENLMKYLERQNNALLMACEGEDTTVTGLFDQNRQQFFQWYDEAVRSLSLPSQEPLRDTLHTVYRRYDARADEMSKMIRQGALADAKLFYYDLVRPESDRLRALCFDLFAINQAAMYNAERRTHAIANQTAFGTMIISVVSLVLSVIASVYIIKVFIIPTEELTGRVKQISGGRLDLKIDVLSDDEIGQLSREFNKMTERLKRYDQLNIDQVLSEKRKSESIVASISDGLIMTDAEQRILHLNSVIGDLFGVDASAATGRPLADVIPDVRLTRLIASAGPEGPQSVPPDLVFERQGKPLFFRPKMARIYDRDGRLYALLTLLHDVTQFKELDRMKSEFIATLSHEFRTPLTSIAMAVDILDQDILGPLNERQRELVGSAREDTVRLTKLSRELLHLSKLESGRLPLKNERLEIPVLVDSCLRPLQLQFKEKGVALATDLAPGLPPLVADEQQLSSVITNLVSNALKYTGSGGRVLVRVREEPGGIRMDVEDTGIGIPPEHLPTVFDKFMQVKQLAESTPGSVGLGLSIAKEVVEMYGGRIWAESTPGTGSTFSFRLPVDPAAPAPTGAQR